MVDFIPRSMQSTGMTCKSDLCQLGVVILDLLGCTPPPVHYRTLSAALASQRDGQGPNIAG